MIGDRQEHNGQANVPKIDGDGQNQRLEQRKEPQLDQHAIAEAQNQSQCHIFTYESPWRIYALGYSWRSDKPFRFGLGSFLEDKTNKVSHFKLMKYRWR